MHASYKPTFTIFRPDGSIFLERIEHAGEAAFWRGCGYLVMINV